MQTITVRTYHGVCRQSLIFGGPTTVADVNLIFQSKITLQIFLSHCIFANLTVLCRREFNLLEKLLFSKFIQVYDWACGPIWSVKSKQKVKFRQRPVKIRTVINVLNLAGKDLG
jgi:hypothetical protein